MKRVHRGFSAGYFQNKQKSNSLLTSFEGCEPEDCGSHPFLVTDIHVLTEIRILLTLMLITNTNTDTNTASVYVALPVV